MPRVTLFLVALLVIGSQAGAQGCPSGSQVFLQNDTLPAVPGGPLSFSVVPGLCDGEACGAVFDVSAVASAVKVDMAAVGYGGAAGGVQASVNLRIHDGITWNAGIPTLGPLVFDYTTATGASIGVTSTAINTQDISSYNVVVTSGTLVVTWHMLFNGDPGGSCATGYPTNFFTDNSGFSFICTAGSQKNLIMIQGQGWRDAATAAVGGVPLCPLFYNGNWVIRACVEPAAGANPNTVTVVPDPVTAGQTAVLTFSAPGQAGNTYVAYPTFSTSPGLTFPGVGTVPVDPNDPLFLLYLSGHPLTNSVFLNFSGVIGPLDTATALINTLPGVPVTFFVGFVVFNGSGQIAAISDAAPITVL